jgi:hypothetical protein
MYWKRASTEEYEDGRAMRWRAFDKALMFISGGVFA